MTKNRQRFIWLVSLLAVCLLLPAVSVMAGSGSPPGDDGIVVWNEDYTLEEGKRLDGSLIVFNGDVTMEVDSHVAGSVIIWNGAIEVEGNIDEDIVVSGGDIYLGDSAYVEGNVVCSWNCDLEQEDGAHIEGIYTEGSPLEEIQIDPRNGIPIPYIPSPTTVWTSGPGRVFDWGLEFIRSAAAILVVAAVAGLVALIWPDSTARIGRTLVESPAPSFGMGLLTSIAVTTIIVLLAITICGSPIAAVAALALGVAGLFGWIGVGAILGERLLQALNTCNVAPLWSAGLGTLVISLIGVLLSSALCLAPIGWLLIFVLGCLGLGAVVLTRFGTTAYAPLTDATHRPSNSTPPTSAPVEAVKEKVVQEELAILPESDSSEEQDPTTKDDQDDKA
ncbi:MAG: hypothetical protein GY832_41385 [Chloroflexi bacterium]|nr:hypothetical protein [Chloroflexota bacterium]